MWLQWAPVHYDESTCTGRVSWAVPTLHVNESQLCIQKHERLLLFSRILKSTMHLWHNICEELSTILHCINKEPIGRCTIKKQDLAWSHNLNSYFTSSYIDLYAVRSSIIHSVVNFRLVLIQVASSKLRNSWLLLKCGGLTC